MSQYDLEPMLDFDPPLDPKADPLERAAHAFHQANPHILREIAKVCLKVRAWGRTRWSINAAFEVVRYNAEVLIDSRTFRLDNNHRAHYARWLMRDFPELKGFFVTRDSGRVKQEY